MIDLSLADQPSAEIIRKYWELAQQNLEDSQRHGELGVVYELHGFMNVAIDEYAAAIELDPTNPIWHYYRALVVANQVNLKTGLATMEKVLELDDLYTAAWLWRGTWFLDLARTSEAKRAFARARDLGSYLPSKLDWYEQKSTSKILLVRSLI